MKMHIGITAFVVLSIAILLMTSTAIAQTLTPHPDATPAPTPTATVSPPQTTETQNGLLDWVSQFGSVAIAAIFAGLLGFFGFQRLQNLDKEIQSARESRDAMTKELRDELRDNIERIQKIQDERIIILETRVNSVVESQRSVIEGIVKSANEKIQETAQVAEQLIAQINEQRNAFHSETAWLRERGLGTKRPRNVREVHDLATAATSIGRREEAIQLLQLIVDSSSNFHGTADDYFNSAVQAASIRDLELAKAINMEGLKHYPDNLDLLTDYADNCGKTGDIEEAERVWRSLSDNPRAKASWRYWIFYSDFLERQGNLEDAYKLLENAKQHLPNPSMAYREQAEQMEDRGRFDEAISLYQEALQHNPSEDIARLKLAQLLFRLGRLEDALEHINWAIRYVLPRNARYFTAHYYKGQILLAMEKRDEAKRALQIAAVHDEDAQVLLTSMALEDGTLDSDTISKVYKL